MKKTLNEITENNGVFAIFAANFATEFAAIFGDTAAATLDNWVKLKFGTRWIIDGITAENLSDFVNAVISVNLFNWVQLATALNTEISVTGNTETRVKTGTVLRENYSTGTTIDANKAFNDTDFVDGDKTTNSGNDTNTDTYNVTETVNKGANAKIDEIRQQIEIRKNNLFADIAKSLIDEITLRIY